MESCSLRRASRALPLVLVALGAACAEGTAIEETSQSSGSTASGDGGGGVGPGGGDASGAGAKTSSSPGSSSVGPSSSTSGTGVTGSGGDGGTSSGDGGTSSGDGGTSSGDGGTSSGDGGASGTGGDQPTTTAATTAAATTASSSATTTSTGGTPVDQLCAPGEFATGVDVDGALTCAPFQPRALSAIASGCYLYVGWLDDCDGCTTTPVKWGWAGTDQCANGEGANGTCVATSLSGVGTISLYGLNFDGDVDGNDKIYGSLHCAVGDVAPQTGPCSAGEFVSAVVNGVVTCLPASGLALGRVRSTCSLYMGWRDECNGCTDPPSKWGRVNDTSCTNGVGSSNTCSVSTLGGESVRLFGLNPDGDLDGNDKLHLGLRCDDAVDDTTTATGTCPAGMLVDGILADGTLRCSSPSAETTAAFRSSCTAYWGIRDSCDGCTTAPAKWGYATAQDCQNGAGTDNSCAATSLGGETVNLFGLNPDGDVDGNDKLYLGFECQ